MTLLNAAYCRDCGKEISANAVACPHCGAQQKRGAESKSKITAFLLAWFFGLLGVHKFYLGQNTQGVIMLLMGTIGWLLVIPAIVAGVWAFIDGIRYLMASEEEFNSKYS